MPCDNCRCWDEMCSWPMGGRGKACRSCKWQWVSCQVNGELVVGGELRPKSKSDGSPTCKKHKISGKTIVGSETEVEEAVTAQPEAWP